MKKRCEANWPTSSYRSKSGKQFRQGDRISGKDQHGDHISGHIDSFVGNSHQTAVIRSAGYTYTVNIADAD
jgi:hypothetical protein